MLVRKEGRGIGLVIGIFFYGFEDNIWIKNNLEDWGKKILVIIFICWYENTLIYFNVKEENVLFCKRGDEGSYCLMLIFVLINYVGLKMVFEVRIFL